MIVFEVAKVFIDFLVLQAGWNSSQRFFLSVSVVLEYYYQVKLIPIILSIHKRLVAYLIQGVSSEEIYPLVISYRKKARAILKNLAASLAITKNERILVYYRYEGYYYSPTSYSKNLLFQTNDIKKVPATDSLFELAQKHGMSYEPGCPCVTEYPEGHVEFLNVKYGIPLDVLEKRVMKSCRFITVAVCHGEEFLGLIAFESVDKGFIGKDEDIERIQRICSEDQQLVELFNLDIGIRESIAIQKKLRRLK